MSILGNWNTFKLSKIDQDIRTKTTRCLVIIIKIRKKSTNM